MWEWEWVTLIGQNHQIGCSHDRRWNKSLLVLYFLVKHKWKWSKWVSLSPRHSVFPRLSASGILGKGPKIRWDFFLSILYFGMRATPWCDQGLILTLHSGVNPGSTQGTRGSAEMPPEWLYASQASYLLYYLSGPRKLCYKSLRSQSCQWIHQQREGKKGSVKIIVFV